MITYRRPSRSIFLPPQKRPVQPTRKIGSIVPRHIPEPCLPSPREWTALGTPGPTIDSGIEPPVHASRRQGLIRVDRVWNGDGFEPVEQGRRSREQLGAHMVTETVLVMHGQQQSPGEPGMRDQRRTAWGLRAPIAVDLVPHNPVGANGVEHGQKADVVCLLADAPFITRVLLGQAYGR